MKKICTKCKGEKEKEEFNKNKTKKDGYQNICKICSREKSKKFYNENIEAQRKIIYKQKKDRKKESREKINEYLLLHPCLDCKNDNLIVLEFDHREPDKKNKAILEMLSTGYSWNKILKEIEKCDVRCANCHRIKTAKQLGYNKNYDYGKCKRN
jgi:hypothetical protein